MTIETERHWQDTVQTALLSKGGLVLSNLGIMIAMLWYSYTSDPADPDDVHSCRWDSNTTLTFCRRAFPGLRDSQSRAIGQSICSIVLVATPLFLWLFMHYTKYPWNRHSSLRYFNAMWSMFDRNRDASLSCTGHSRLLLLWRHAVQVCFLWHNRCNPHFDF